MRVALDVTATITGSTGVARYARQIAAALTQQGVETVPYAIGRPQHPVPPGVRHVAIPLRVVHRSWSWAGRPRAESIVPGVDLVHALDLVPPPTKLPVVVTVHDLTVLEHPEFHPARRVRSQRAQLAAARRAQAVLCVSHATARRVVALGVEPAKVVVSHLGLTPLPAPAGDVDLPPRPYLLAVGELNRRKGHDLLLEAFAAAKLEGMALVFAGPRGFDPEFYEQLAKRLGVRASTHLLGAVDDATLAGLYRNAVALCFPSRAEGFGLPVLEALGAGLPVVASDLDAVREVADDNALYASPGDPASLAAALRRIVEDEALRARLVAGGKRRAAGFTWEQTAMATIDAYRLALT